MWTALVPLEARHINMAVLLPCHMGWQGCLAVQEGRLGWLAGWLARRDGWPGWMAGQVGWWARWGGWQGGQRAMNLWGK